MSAAFTINGLAGADRITGGDFGAEILDGGAGLGSNIKTIYVDLQNDGAGNNLGHAEIVIYVDTSLSGFGRNFIIAEGHKPNADILI